MEPEEPLNNYEKIVYDRLFEKGSPIILSEHTTFYKVFESIDKELKKNIKVKIRDIKSDSKIAVGAIITIVTLLMSLISFYGIEDLDPSLRWLYGLSFGCVIVNLFFTIIMGRKTAYGEVISARVAGFREFLNTAEKYRLEELVNDNPKYFYNILPYTYVLGISKKWVKNFENIPIPDVDMGNFDYSSDGDWGAFNSGIYYPPSSSGGGSSCGGGCSSCGGGCSSCGGGGSW